MDAAELTEITTTKRWIESFVLPHNLCPFAHKVFKQNTIHYSVCSVAHSETCLTELANHCTMLDGNPSIETSIVILPALDHSFDRYLDLLDLSIELLSLQGYEGVYQLASFHPNYCFEGTHVNDPTNFTNRSPHAMLHLLRESTIDRSLKQYDNPESIPVNNMARMKEMGLNQLAQQFQQICHG